jgi:hypothetical protein
MLLAMTENLIPSGNWLSALASTTLIFPSSARVTTEVENANPASKTKVVTNTNERKMSSDRKCTLVLRQCRLTGLPLRVEEDRSILS